MKPWPVAHWLFHQHWQAFAHAFAQDFGAYALLDFHEPLAAFLPQVHGHLIFKPGRPGSFFCLIGEYAQMIEAGFFHKAAKFCKVGLAFARVAHNHGCA